MRDTIPRPAPIAVPGNHSINTLTCNPYFRLPATTATNTRFGGLSLKDQFTPGPATAFYCGLQIPKPAKHSFFRDMPAELREKIYEALLEGVVVFINASEDNKDSTVEVFRRKAMSEIITRTPYLTANFRHTPQRTCTNWLCTSKQFFYEAREVMWRTMVVKFDRRWDFLHAIMLGGLDPRPAPSSSTTASALNLFPRTDILTKVRELHLNLTQQSDFGRVLHTVEARHVTESILTTMAGTLPRLRALILQVDHRSRLSTSITCFLPDAWFLESLVSLRQITMFAITSGPGWNSHSQNKKSARQCVAALNRVMSKHFTKDPLHPRYRLDWDGLSGRALQARVGMRMLEYFRSFPVEMNYEAYNALAMKVVMLQAGL